MNAVEAEEKKKEDPTCQICGGDNEPGGGISKLCDTPHTPLVVYEYDVKDLCSSTDIGWAFHSRI